MKVKVLTNPFRIGIFTVGGEYKVACDLTEFGIYLVEDNNGMQRPMHKSYCEKVKDDNGGSK